MLFGVVVLWLVQANHQLAVDRDGLALDVESFAVLMWERDAYTNPARLLLFFVVRKVFDDKDAVAIDLLRLR
jgi:hypothetical protein